MAKSKVDQSDRLRAETDGRRRRGLKARGNVLGRAIDVASKNGLEALTLGSLASDLGISKGNITILFGDKEALQLKTLDAAIDIFTTKVVRPAMIESSPILQLQKLCSLWFDSVEQRLFPGGCIISAMSNEYRARRGPIHERVKYHRDAWHALFANTVRAAIKEGEIDPVQDVNQLVFELLAYQLAANTASLLGDKRFFLIAKRSTRARIAGIRID
ncbi:TetR/AcrR family transcriptional regulator [Bradyrhizobium sp.]|uniref:TetR/AcrR family transcriptional regulator n=1 Tax=Bradyrhizobium sp. TaxID=376 RepID=UPI002614322B|nr:TetR/AcrR family transcriptional regulator [Bradyrhizobium sp.]